LETLSAHTSYLIPILNLFVKDIFPPYVRNRLGILISNNYGGECLEIQRQNQDSIESLAKDLSRLIAIPTAAVERFRKEPLKVQLALYERYQFASDTLGDMDEIVAVPNALDELFRWFFIKFWGNPG